MPLGSVLVASLTFIEILATSVWGQVYRPKTSTQVRKQFVLGQRRAEDLERKDGRINDQAIVGYVQEIASRLAHATGGRAFDVRITLGSDWYAYLLPQGVLYISGSLFERVENEAELAGLLAHQLAHMQGTIAPTRDQSTTASPLSLCVLASQIAPTVWSEDRRESELLATKAAVKTLRDTGYEPSAVLDLLSKLAYEHPAWAKAIVPEDLLNLRAILETDVHVLPQDGYRIDSSQFKQQHARVAVALGHTTSHKPAPKAGIFAPTLTESLPR